MKNQIDRVGVLGTILGAIAAAAPCCLPLLASVGASLGFGALARFQGPIVYLLQVFVSLAVVGAFIGFRQHKKWGPLVVATASAGCIFYAYNIQLSQALVYSGLLGLVVAAVWNMIAARKCASCTPASIQRQSTITCPSCGHQREETMPLDSCQFFYECLNCHTKLKPKKGDCCVFCSYGSAKCPPMQNGACAC